MTATGGRAGGLSDAFNYLLMGLSTLAAASPMSLTTVIPECKLVNKNVLPDAYRAPPRRKGAFAWVKEANRKSTVLGGGGYERADGSNLHVLYSVILKNGCELVVPLRPARLIKFQIQTGMLIYLAKR